MHREALFNPIFICKKKIKNRIALAPSYMGTGDSRGRVTDQTLCYYSARAKGGCGLIIVEGTGAVPKYSFAPNTGLSIVTDDHISGFRDLSQVIHWGGAIAFLQLMLGQGSQALQSNGNRELVGPSNIPALIQKKGLPKALAEMAKKNPQTPRALSIDEIQYLKDCIISAAKRAKRAGFDGIEIHGAHGYLLGQFTSPYFNRRNDLYGGVHENRMRLSLEIVEKIKETAGSDFAVGYRLSANEGIPGGMEVQEAALLAEKVEKAGADYISVSSGCYGALSMTMPKGEGHNTKDAAFIKKHIHIPVICANFLNPESAERAVSGEFVDVIALSRPLIADPQWPQKVRLDQEQIINKCIRCYYCVRNFNIERLPVRCLVNPMLGYERFDPSAMPSPPKEPLLKEE